jgi:hypothetical protein
VPQLHDARRPIALERQTPLADPGEDGHQLNRRLGQAVGSASTAALAGQPERIGFANAHLTAELIAIYYRMI